MGVGKSIVAEPVTNSGNILRQNSDNDNSLEGLPFGVRAIEGVFYE